MCAVQWAGRGERSRAARGPLVRGRATGGGARARAVVGARALCALPAHAVSAYRLLPLPARAREPARWLWRATSSGTGSGTRNGCSGYDDNEWLSRGGHESPSAAPTNQRDGPHTEAAGGVASGGRSSRCTDSDELREKRRESRRRRSRSRRRHSDSSRERSSSRDSPSVTHCGVRKRSHRHQKREHRLFLRKRQPCTSYA